ncbi:MAG TPA: alanine--glyoxylate aminotransferase family protein [Candidatus Limnocylindria bacterium]|nr:alanine--glyoxylate aminotransferase family protein [Candidatus Limnocylindria bacterium]
MSEHVNLRIPGPTPLPERVREAGSSQMLNHRGPEFRELITRVTQRLQRAFRTQNDVLTLTASGTGGMEAAVVNHLSQGDPVLAVSIGSFGDRFAEVATRYGAQVVRHDVEWGRAARPEQVSEALAKMAAEGRPAKAVLLTHNETSTGVTNPLEELAAAARDASPDTLIIVDGVSGLGAVPFDNDGWGLDIVATGSQKSWMVPPGLAMVSVSERAWQAAATASMPRYYFDLAEARKFLGKGETPWTPAVSVLLQLDVALDMLEAEGYEQIFARHAACGAAARAGLEAMGFRLLAEREHASNTVTAAWLPDGVEWSALNRELLARNLVLAGGQGKLAGRILRIGHLGAVSVDEVVSAIETIEAAALELGLAVESGAGPSAASEAGREAVPTPA